MKSGKIIALGLLALLPIAMKAQEAQEIEKLNARIDSLSQETTTLDKIVRKLSKFKVSAYTGHIPRVGCGSHRVF